MPHRRYGFIGYTYSLANHRRRGHAEACKSRLCRCLLDLGLTPYLTVEPDNLPSLSMNKKLGFRMVPEIKGGFIVSRPQADSH